MIRFKAIRKILSVALAMSVVLAAIAYGTPYVRARDCRELAIRHLEQNPVRGRGMDREWISAKPSDVWVYVTGPLTSEASYSVPNDMHSIVYTHQCKSTLLSASLGPRKRQFTL